MRQTPNTNIHTSACWGKIFLKKNLPLWEGVVKAKMRWGGVRVVVKIYFDCFMWIQILHIHIHTFSIHSEQRKA